MLWLPLSDAWGLMHDAVPTKAERVYLCNSCVPRNGRSDETDTHTDAHTRTQTSKQMGFCVAKNRRNLRNGNAHRP